MFDEVDAFFGPKAKEHEELRGLLNAGHRRGAVAYRCVGEQAKTEIRAFPAFCPVALARIGGLPDTILDRSVLVMALRCGQLDERHVQALAHDHRVTTAYAGEWHRAQPKRRYYSRFGMWPHEWRSPPKDVRQRLRQAATGRRPWSGEAPTR